MFIGAAMEGCYGECKPLSEPPTPVPQPPITGQPMPTVSDECLNCMAAGGKCCPPHGRLCACANPSLPCSRYGCAGD